MARKPKQPGVKGRPGRHCTTCKRKDRTALDGRLSRMGESGETIPQIAADLHIPERTLRDHYDKHLPGALRVIVARHAELTEETADLDVLASLGRIARQMEAYFGAAHRWLQDPDDPTRYTLAPRETEVTVIWEQEIPKDNGDGFRTVKRKERLVDLLKRCGEKGGPPPEEILMVELNTGNPRKLFLDGVTAGKPLYELLGKATGQIKPDDDVRRIEERTRMLIEMTMDELRELPDVRARLLARVSTVLGVGR